MPVIAAEDGSRISFASRAPVYPTRSALEVEKRRDGIALSRYLENSVGCDEIPSAAAGAEANPARDPGTQINYQLHGLGCLSDGVPLFAPHTIHPIGTKGSGSKEQKRPVLTVFIR